MPGIQAVGGKKEEEDSINWLCLAFPPEETRFNFSASFMYKFVHSEIFSRPPQKSNRNKRPEVIT